MFDDKNNQIGYRGIIKDITDKKNAEEALFRSLRDLDQANKELNYLNATLEEKVKKRTQELNEKMAIVANQNKRLQKALTMLKESRHLSFLQQKKLNNISQILLSIMHQKIL